MFEDRKRRRELKRRIADLDRWQDAEIARLKERSPEEISNFGIVVAECRLKRTQFEKALEVLAAERLLKWAVRWGVNCYAPMESYQVNPSSEAQRYFKPEAKETMRKMIRDARRKRFKEWIEILSPVATVIISLLALVLSIVALYRT